MTPHGGDAALPGPELGPFLKRVRYHGVQGILNATPSFQAAAGPDLAGAVSRMAMADAVHEEVHRTLLREVFDAFAAAEIPFLVLKGTAVAYLFHEDPAARPRCDTDLFVPEDRLSDAESCLASLGFQTSPVYAPVYQHTHAITRHGMSLEIDLHWRAANSEVISRAFEFDPMLADSQPVPRLHPAARAPSSADLLCFAIMHMALDQAHRSGARMIWLDDMALIARRLGEAGWASFLRGVEVRGLAGVARSSLNKVEAKFGGLVPQPVTATLNTLPNGALSDYLSASRTQRFRQELAIRPPADALRFLWQVVLPDRARLAAKYGAAPAWKVPWLYARRAVSGLRQWRLMR
ncbi:Uncharacterised nucleotidyltransferase [Tropicimonas isoalkanivorans]|uniref:Uncharacterized nucleotidyltransferase n=2 Tax=Tropicimonas isoalkanivorans TaxID=441112 RepID=A0A1I1N959_9RHOB|nr:Uncharacterised nucleotidyltransferase [Tropicimonas isoalkanivorans]